MIGVGVAAIIANIDPPDYLQAIVVMSTSVGASALAIPMLMACYWRRATSNGTLTAMLAGAGVVLMLFGLGQIHAAATDAGIPLAGIDAGADAIAALQQWLGPPQTIGMAKGFKPYFVSRPGAGRVGTAGLGDLRRRREPADETAASRARRQVLRGVTNKEPRTE